MKRIVVVITAAVMSLASGYAVAAQKVSVCGTGDSQALLRTLGWAYEAGHPGVQIEVPDSIGSGGGIKAAARDRCDLGRVARGIKKKEEKYNLNYALFALSPIVFAVNGVDGLKDLSNDQIIGIYSGKIGSWDSLGVLGSKIYVANREPGDSSRSVLEKKLPGFRDIKGFAGKVIFSTPEAVQTMSQHKYTIGYAPLSMVRGKGIQVISVKGVYPSTENVQNGKYKLVTPLGLVWKGELKGAPKEFFDYLFSHEAAEIISASGAVPAK